LVLIKGHRYLIEAMGLLRDRGITVELWLAGEGELDRDLRRQVESLALNDRVRFLGQLSHTAVLDLYRENQVALTVVPSIVMRRFQYEGIPVSLIEAMAFGIPVVATETGGIPELLEGGAGLLVAHSDPAALANAIERLVSSAELWCELSQRGRQRVQDEFAIDVNGERLSDLFEQCVSQRGQTTPLS
jgi:glycosyltransferase involved in cell wall biosynthesis